MSRKVFLQNITMAKYIHCVKLCQNRCMKSWLTAKIKCFMRPQWHLTTKIQCSHPWFQVEIWAKSEEIHWGVPEIQSSKEWNIGKRLWIRSWLSPVWRHNADCQEHSFLTVYGACNEVKGREQWCGLACLSWLHLTGLLQKVQNCLGVLFQGPCCRNVTKVRCLAQAHLVQLRQ